MNKAAFAERALVRFEEPPSTGRCVAVSTVDFDAGTLADTREIRVVREPDAVEVPLSIIREELWPDGSVMSAEIVFLVEGVPTGKQFWVEWGGAERAKSFSYSPSQDLAKVSFAVGPDESSSIDVTIGSLPVRLDRNPGIFYYWYLIPIGAILALLIYRKRRLS